MSQAPQIRSTDQQIDDLAHRMAVVLMRLGARLGYAEMEVCTMVNLVKEEEI